MKLNTSHFTHVRDCVRYIKVQNHACTKPLFGSFVREILNENDYLSKNNLLTETASNDKQYLQRNRNSPWGIQLVVQQAYSNRFHRNTSSVPCKLPSHYYILVDIPISVL
jgi:hypothetical protein